MNWQLVLPCLYTKSSSKAEPWTQSQVWGERREHNIGMAMLVQHLVLHTHTHTHTHSLARTHCLSQSLSLLPTWNSPPGYEQHMRVFAILF